MAQQQSLVEESVDRLQEAFESVSEEIESLQKRADKRRKRLEKDTRKRVESLQRDFRRTALGKRATRLQKDIEKSEIVKRAQQLRKDAGKRFEGVVDDFLGALQIATRSDVQKLDRKLNQINRKLNELESARKKRSATSRAPRNAAAH